MSNYRRAKIEGGVFFFTAVLADRRSHRVRDWPLSSFHRFVAHNVLPEDWGGNVKDLSGAFGE